jgi:hypothetical protein
MTTTATKATATKPATIFIAIFMIIPYKLS